MRWPPWTRRRPVDDAPPEVAAKPVTTDSTVDDLLVHGREQQAIEVLRNHVAAQPTDLATTLRLAELLCGRLEHTAARPLLERLVRAPAQRERAFLLLAEEAERAGDLDRALVTWQRLLAYDLDNVRARAAAQRLGPELPRRELQSMPASIGRRYELRSELGRGASGTVYRAEDVAVQREVALKILHPSARGAGDATSARLRAWQEARISATLRHAGVAAIFDLDEERQLIAMELCRGGSLRDRLIAGPLPARDAVRALAQLADVLAAAHAAGIVHGDVKPANLLLRHPLAADLQVDELVLCDFGVARLSDDASPAIEQRATRGTLVYMAPEQRLGQLGAASDVYAAGVVAIELLGGHDALGAALGDRAALLRGDLFHDATLSAPVAATLGPSAAALEALLHEVLAKEPGQRPTAAALAARARALVI